MLFCGSESLGASHGKLSRRKAAAAATASARDRFGSCLKTRTRQALEGHQRVVGARVGRKRRAAAAQLEGGAFGKVEGDCFEPFRPKASITLPARLSLASPSAAATSPAALTALHTSASARHGAASFRDAVDGAWERAVGGVAWAVVKGTPAVRVVTGARWW
ncbi:hypothetical protein DFJ73DRAFT_782555 [Zopfochytrium polystomum]|nr:hypothetical protein DFJ73DRAFT_782555 [Zopfochytrium polystomum]